MFGSGQSGSPTKCEAAEDCEQPTEANSRRSNSDAVESYSSLKLPMAYIMLISISFIVLGCRLNAYGERYWDFRHNSAWWLEYGFNFLGGVGILAVIAPLLAHLAILALHW